MKPHLSKTCFFILIFLGILAGCSSQHKRTVEESVLYSSPTGQGVSQAVVKEEKTVEKTESKQTHSAGVIGSVFHLIGQVLALPFRLVAGAIEFIF